MKKLFALLLCILMALQLASCTQNETENTPLPPPNTEEQLPPANYDRVIELYTKAIDTFKRYSKAGFLSGIDIEELAITDTREKEIFSRLFQSIRSFYFSAEYLDPTSMYCKAFSGYSEKDLNGDGVKELIILSDFSVMAIFTFRNGVPFLLKNYTVSDHVWISENGNIHQTDSYNLMTSFSHSVYQIAEDCSSLELIEEFGVRSNTIENRVFESNYYKLANGEYTEINESAYLVLEHQHGKYVSSEKCVAITKSFLQNSFVNIISGESIATNKYQKALYNQIPIYDTIEVSYLMKNYKLPVSNLPLYEISNLKYAYLDMDGDLISEMILDAGEFLQLSYRNDKVYIQPITEQALIQANGGAPVAFSPLNVSWNQLLSAQQALEIASGYWGFDHGELLGRPSPNVQNKFRIVTGQSLQINGRFYFQFVSYIDSYRTPIGAESKPFQMEMNQTIYVDRTTGNVELFPHSDEGK